MPIENLFFFLFRVRPKCSGECRPPDEKIPQRSWLLENNIALCSKSNGRCDIKAEKREELEK